MPFSPETKARMFTRCARVCCLCSKLCGTNIEAAHIIQEATGGSNDESNGIPVCFDCHQEIGAYDNKHPRGNKFLPQELLARRDRIYALVESGAIIMGQTQVQVHNLMAQRKSATIEDELRHQYDSQGYQVELLFDIRARGASVASPLNCRLDVLIRDLQATDTIHYRDSMSARLTDEKNRFRCYVRLRAPTSHSRTPAFVGIRVIPEKQSIYAISSGIYGNTYELYGQNKRQFLVEQISSIQWESLNRDHRD